MKNVLSLLCLLCLSPLAMAQSSTVNLNSADASTLARELEGIGDSKARAIVEYRQKNGPFRKVEDLALVKGIGLRTIELNRGRLRVEAVGPAAVRPAKPGAPTVRPAPTSPIKPGR